ncbi:Alpha/Beta hydrolase protein [Piptocephalis cylindrospora]|uniref:Alpha/Beta hydrolase protein n=1 Tax=Piptocephalis cylindrospora TaxID=1907219 RepID=A0A4P9Y1H4_9FUNG|nr:Alpha/Beta hydrolase protein [Piptocephalis cylindrospora]|eukprot:RKP12637.1 Alpha/Beta hydrolase protein [Piptocephalis cylindrospora]
MSLARSALPRLSSAWTPGRLGSVTADLGPRPHEWTSRARVHGGSRPPLSRVSLVSTVHKAPTSDLPSVHPPIVVLHGLFGSKQNWRSLSRALTGQTFVDVHALDLRNHGESPQDSQMDYTVMAEDVAGYLEEQGIGRAFILGHSMGAKVAMTLALHPDAEVARRVQGLVAVDMAPRRAPLSLDFQTYLRAMQRINEARPHKSSQADALLSPDVPDVGVRQFLLTNCKRSAPTEPYTFRLPLAYLEKALPNLSDFPPSHSPHPPVYHGPSLFVRGSRSSYLGDEDTLGIQTYFPKAVFSTLDAGHWVHAEKPTEFLEAVSTFYNDVTSALPSTLDGVAVRTLV